MKSAAERGRIGAWAYEARADADLSVEQVVERLARAGQPVASATIRGIEGGSKQPGRRLLRALATVYGVAPPNEKPGSESVMASDPGYSLLAEALERQTTMLGELLAAFSRDLAQRDSRIRDLEDLVTALAARELGAAKEPVSPRGTGE